MMSNLFRPRVLGVTVFHRFEEEEQLGYFVPKQALDAIGQFYEAVGDPITPVVLTVDADAVTKGDFFTEVTKAPNLALLADDEPLAAVRLAGELYPKGTEFFVITDSNLAYKFTTHGTQVVIDPGNLPLSDQGILQKGARFIVKMTKYS